MNEELLDAAVEWASREAQLAAKTGVSAWDQSLWAFDPKADDREPGEVAELEPGCGTSFCIAGWICYQAGDRFVFRFRDPVPTSVETVFGERKTIWGRAAALLEVDEEDLVKGLFSGDNTLMDLYREAACLKSRYRVSSSRKG